MAITTLFPRISKDREVFIETGTKDGTTLEEAAKWFPLCISVELDQQNFHNCLEKFKDRPGIEVVRGYSPSFIERYSRKELATTFYLDAHYEGGDLTYQKPECPLLDELYAILAFDWVTKPIIVVDDINMFKLEYWSSTTSNHHLFRSNEWPRLTDILSVLEGYDFEEDETNNVGIFT